MLTPPDSRLARDHRTGTGPRPRVVYVAGSGRSGSTALARVIERDLVTTHAGEVRYLWDRGIGEDQLCQCGARFSRCPWWLHVIAGAYGETLLSTAATLDRVRPEVDRVRHVPALLAQARTGRRSAAVQAYARLLAPTYDAMALAADGGTVLDSSKDPSYLFALAATGRIDLRVLHLVRDSRAVAHSWTRRKLRPEIHWEQQYMKTLRPTRAAQQWSINNATIESVRLLDVPYLRLRYEDFANGPAAAVDRVADELGLERRSAPAHLEDGHSFSGNPMRFDGPVTVRLDEAWREELPARDRQRVTAITAPLLAAYGYLGDGR